MPERKKDRLRKVDVPIGKSGDWEVSRFKVSESDANFHNLVESINGGRRTIVPGVYTKLTYSGQIVMSDTPAELSDHWAPVREARCGHVLVNGLGLGVVLQAVLDEQNVDHLTVIEKFSEVIKLVAQHWLIRYGDRLTIIHADALSWKAPKRQRYSVVWHDIWNNICSDNLPAMHKLHRKYGRRCDWQGSWCRWMCETER